jgi:hypothetical protein
VPEHTFVALLCLAFRGFDALEAFSVPTLTFSAPDWLFLELLFERAFAVGLIQTIASLALGVSGSGPCTSGLLALAVVGLLGFLGALSVHAPEGFTLTSPWVLLHASFTAGFASRLL